MLLALGAVREAQKDFDRAIVLAPGYAAAFSNRTSTCMRLDLVDEAITDYTSAIKLTPTSAAALSGRGRAQLAAQRPHSAIRDFTRAVSAEAGMGPPTRSRAEAKLAIERYEEAIEDFGRAIAFEPRNAEVYALRGQAYLLAANAPSAVNAFFKAIELAPGTATYFVVARLGLRQGGDLRGRAQRFLQGDRAGAARAQGLRLPGLDLPPAAAARARPEGRRARFEARRQQRGSLLGAWRDRRLARGRGEQAIADLRGNELNSMRV